MTTGLLEVSKLSFKGASRTPNRSFSAILRVLRVGCFSTSPELSTALAENLQFVESRAGGGLWPVFHTGHRGLAGVEARRWESANAALTRIAQSADAALGNQLHRFAAGACGRAALD